jgi:hypothetical protein
LRETTVGVGIGLPLGVIALATVGWALWERRRRKQAPVVAVTPSPGSSPGEAKPPAIYDTASMHRMERQNACRSWIHSDLLQS